MQYLSQNHNNNKLIYWYSSNIETVMHFINIDVIYLLLNTPKRMDGYNGNGKIISFHRISSFPGVIGARGSPGIIGKDYIDRKGNWTNPLPIATHYLNWMFTIASRGKEICIANAHTMIVGKRNWSMELLTNKQTNKQKPTNTLLTTYYRILCDKCDRSKSCVCVNWGQLLRRRCLVY